MVFQSVRVRNQLGGLLHRQHFQVQRRFACHILLSRFTVTSSHRTVAGALRGIRFINSRRGHRARATISIFRRFRGEAYHYQIRHTNNFVARRCFKVTNWYANGHRALFLPAKGVQQMTVVLVTGAGR